MNKLIDEFLLAGTEDGGKGTIYFFIAGSDITWKKNLTDPEKDIGKIPFLHLPFMLALIFSRIVERR